LSSIFYKYEKNEIISLYSNKIQENEKVFQYDHLSHIKPKQNSMCISDYPYINDENSVIDKFVINSFIKKYNIKYIFDEILCLNNNCSMFLEG
jgi:hypothetical protein